MLHGVLQNQQTRTPKSCAHACQYGSTYSYVGRVGWEYKYRPQIFILSNNDSSQGLGLV